MKKKIFSIILVLFVAFIIFSDKVCAWYAPSGNNTALVVGASYSDGRNSAEHSNNTYSTYQSMGLTSKKFFNPAIGDLKGKHFPAVSYLESGIIYFSGHGNNHNMNYNTFDISDCSHNGDNYIGIGSYNNSKTAFIEYAGCKTAEGSSNITEYSQYVGVNITMGWTTDLYEDSFKNWNKRFNNKIKDKATSVDSAAKSASNYIYVHNEVKNYKVYGYGDTNPWYWIYGNSSSKSKSQTGQVYNNGYNLESKNGKSFYLLDNQEELDTKVDNFINNEIGSSFNRDNYKLEINGNDVKYFDYVLYYDDIRTNLGYTVSVDKTGIT
ncbi:MAG TPA: hypothetical protein DCE23_04665 [Firmicutes bacterium]|nr:hypothetical protein [Bacillota bacterium]